MFVVTLLLFYTILASIPFFILSYFILQISYKIWLLIISIRYPHLEFLKVTTVRSLLDTHRNQGIISVLLSIKGQAQPETVRRHLQEVVRRRDKSGNLTFPRLRHCLTTRCGTYAWERGHFDLDQNLTVAPVSYRGRAITELNIQDCVNEIVAKYLPQGLPPWQMVIIPSADDHHYVLLKLHHVLLNEHLNIGDLLPLIPPTRALHAAPAPSPLVDVLPRPLAIPLLRQRLAEELANAWNEFIAACDPLERIKLLKSNPGFFQMQAILLVALVATVTESRKGFRVIQDNLYSKVRFLLLTLGKESGKRRLTVGRYLTSILVTLNPTNLVRVAVRIGQKSITYPLKLQMAIWSEFLAIYSIVVYSYCQYNTTLTGAIYNYVPLFYNSIKEVIYYLRIVFEGPRTILEDILLEKEQFQTMTLCGRKSVAWSEPVKMDLIHAIAKKTGISETAILTTAISACISKYFIQTKHLIPNYLPITLRNINSNYIFGTGANLKPEDSVSGVLCLNLPIPDPEKDATLMENLMVVREHFATSIERQGLSHLLSLCQTKFGFLTKIVPLGLLGVYLRYLSRKYAVSVTELSSRYPNVRQKTLWGQEVSSVIYWRPPQANSSVSLCLNEYADHVKLGVMCDSQLVPHHPTFVRGFPDFIQEIARGAQIDF